MIIVRNTVIPFNGFIAITLWPFIFVRRQAWAKFTNDTIRHECIHGRQQVELLAVGAVLSAVLALCGAGWWSLLALPLFLWLYGLEYLVRLCQYRISSPYAAYLAISFEREAYDYELDADYLKKRKPFAWLKYIK